ncbi:MAG: SHOCT domain-containing protein [Ilumatobacter sp.]|nr:SHOCT domain-containing protein [Ilumatobacter sp.]
MLLAAEFGTGQVLWSMLWFFLFFLWIMLIFNVIGDIFRSEMSGWSKALWTMFVIFLPLLGVLIYMIVNGSAMQERSMAQAAAMDQASRAYIQEAAGSSASAADEIAKLNDLKNSGAISEDEFNAAKAKLLA